MPPRDCHDITLRNHPVTQRSDSDGARRRPVPVATAHGAPTWGVMPDQQSPPPGIPC